MSLWIEITSPSTRSRLFTLTSGRSTNKARRFLVVSFTNREINSKVLHGKEVQSMPLLPTSKQLCKIMIGQIKQIRLLTQACLPTRTPFLFPCPCLGTLRIYRCLESDVCTGTHFFLELLLLGTWLLPTPEILIVLGVYCFSLETRFDVLSEPNRSGVACIWTIQL